MKKLVLISMLITSKLSGGVKYPHHECQTIRSRKMFICRVHTGQWSSFCYFADKTTPLAVSVGCEQYNKSVEAHRKNTNVNNKKKKK